MKWNEWFEAEKKLYQSENQSQNVSEKFHDLYVVLSQQPFKHLTLF